MDSMKFTLTLEDVLSGPASRMDGALDRVERGLKDLDAPLKRLDRGLDTLASRFDAVDRRMSATNKILVEGAKQSRTLQTAQLEMLAAIESNARRSHAELLQVVRDFGAATSAAQRFHGATRGGSGGGLLRGIFGAELTGGGLFGTRMFEGLMPALFVANDIAQKVRSAVGAGVGVAKFGIDASDEKRRDMLGLEMMTGGKRQAGEAFDFVNKVADLTPLENRDVMGYFQQLYSAGFKDQKDITTILAGISDIAAMKGSSAADGVMRQLLQVNAKDKLLGQDLNAMAENAPGLVGRAQLQAIVAERRKVSLKEAGNLLEGKLGGREATAYIMEGISRALGGQKLGEFSLKQATGSFEGLSSTLKSKFRRLFEDVDTGPLTGAMDKLQQLIDPSSETGARAKASVERMFTALMAPFERYTTPDGLKKLESDLNSVLDVLEGITTGMGLIAKKLAGDATKEDNLKLLSAFMPDTAAAISDRWAEQRAQMNDYTAREQSINTFGPPGLRAFDVEAPLRPVAHAAGGIVTSPHVGLVGEAGPELILPLAKAPEVLAQMGGRSGAPQVHVTVHASGADSSAAAETIAARVTEILPSALASAFEQLALQQGAP